MWDLRSFNSGPLLTWKTENSGFSIDCLSPNNSNYFITGSKDSNVYKYDMRKGCSDNFMNSSGDYELKYSNHKSSNVRVVSFHPSKKGIFASGGDDGKIFIYDENKMQENNVLSQINSNINKWDVKTEESYKFEHERHIGKIMDLKWHPTRPLTIASADSEGDLQIWTMNIINQSR